MEARTNHHVIRVRSSLPAANAQHIEAHELTHIRLEALARQRKRNRWFATTAATREVAIHKIASDIRKLEKKGYGDDSITNVILDLVQGLCGFLFNTPLDMLIETWIRRDLPSLHSAQFISLNHIANEALASITNPEVRKLTPQKMLRATTALNGVYAQQTIYFAASR